MSESQDIEVGGIAPAAATDPSSNIASTIANSMPDAVSTTEAAVPAATEESQPSLFDQTEAPVEERPNWLPEKFKTGEDLGKSYQELEKKLGAHAGAPENYEMTVSEGLEDYAIDSENSLAKGFFDVLKENGVNQKTADALMNLHAEQAKADDEVIAMAEEQTFREDCKAVGPEAVQEIKESIQWAKGIMSEDSYDLLRTIGNKNLEVGKMISDLHKAYASKDFVKMPETSEKLYSRDDLHEQIKVRLADPRSGRDKEFSKRTTEMYETFLG